MSAESAGVSGAALSAFVLSHGPCRLPYRPRLPTSQFSALRQENLVGPAQLIGLTVAGPAGADSASVCPAWRPGQAVGAEEGTQERAVAWQQRRAFQGLGGAAVLHGSELR